MQRKFLWRPDPPKAKDYDAGSKLRVRGPLPERVSLRNLIVDVLDQGSLGSCVTNAIFQAVRAAHVRANVASPLLGSRLWGYYFARAQGGNTQIDEGTHIRAAFDTIRKLGFPPEAIWTYDDGPDKFRQMPPAAAVRAAYDQRASVGYYRISSTGQQRIEDVKAALAAGYCVAFGTTVTDKFRLYRAGDSPLHAPTPDETILGGHALLCVGYNVVGGETIFEILNSWGALYGEHGYCQFMANYMAWSQTEDLWVVEYLPNFSE